VAEEYGPPRKAPRHVLCGHNKEGAQMTTTTRSSPESEAAYRAINLHFHDLRHEAGSRLIEGGWPVHHVLRDVSRARGIGS
jgi:hypothetical protein